MQYTVPGHPVHSNWCILLEGQARKTNFFNVKWGFSRTAQKVKLISMIPKLTGSYVWVCIIETWLVTTTRSPLRLLERGNQQAQPEPSSLYVSEPFARPLGALYSCSLSAFEKEQAWVSRPGGSRPNVFVEEHDFSGILCYYCAYGFPQEGCSAFPVLLLSVWLPECSVTKSLVVWLNLHLYISPVRIS